MAALDQRRFVEAAAMHGPTGGVDTAALMLSGLAMFGILPALVALDRYSRDRVLGDALRSLRGPFSECSCCYSQNAYPSSGVAERPGG